MVVTAAAEQRVSDRGAALCKLALQDLTESDAGWRPWWRHAVVQHDGTTCDLGLGFGGKILPGRVTASHEPRMKNQEIKALITK
jgi:hypothetical protein